MLTSELEGLLYGRELDSPVVKVVRALSGHGAVSTSQIARNTGLARSTVSTILADLKRSNLVVEMEARNPGPGRPAVAPAGRSAQLNLALWLVSVRFLSTSKSLGIAFKWLRTTVFIW